MQGLSVGDVLGERYFIQPDAALPVIRARALPAPPWRFIDDTQMALAIMACLERYGEIDQPTRVWKRETDFRIGFRCRATPGNLSRGVIQVRHLK